MVVQVLAGVVIYFVETRPKERASLSDLHNLACKFGATCSSTGFTHIVGTRTSEQVSAFCSLAATCLLLLHHSSFCYIVRLAGFVAHGITSVSRQVDSYVTTAAACFWLLCLTLSTRYSNASALLACPIDGLQLTRFLL